ncbi:XrtA system polysaccharide chain length determinant [Aquincola sp. MAHUQ-54]|uniref:XrtA system polysaccharide chain length determinant n=1 Tax=Aquincola agrisoli TaxID=3119538 RepID=A0AAW9QHF2_9BURK
MTQPVLPSLIDRLHGVSRMSWRRRWLAVGVAWAFALAGAVVVPLIPQRYEARALVYVDTQSVLKPLMAGLAYQPDMDQQVRLLARTVVSRPHMEWLVDQPGMGLPIATPAQREATLTRLMKQIRLTIGDAGLYTISFRDPDPEVARRVVEATVTLFVDTSFEDKRRDSQDASRFIADRIAGYEAKLVAAEERLKQFKLLHFGTTGVHAQDYFSRMSMLSDEVVKLSVDLKAAERASEAYRREMAQEEARVASDPDLEPTGAPSPVAAALANTWKQLADLSNRYTEAHPEIISLREQVVRLEGQRAAEAAARAASSSPGRARAANPVYQRLRVALVESEAQVASLRSRLDVEQQRLDAARAVAGKAPQVEAELVQLNRDYDVIRKNYEQLVARRESASLGVQLDESSRMAEFRVVEPPRVQPGPVFPGRPLLAAAAAALALLAGLAAPRQAERLRPTFTDVQSLRKFTARPVLGTVSTSPHQRSHQAERSERRRVALAVGALLAVQAAWIGWIALGAAS